MANTGTSETLASARRSHREQQQTILHHTLKEEEGINKISALVNSQRLVELKNNQSEIVTRGSLKQTSCAQGSSHATVLENMKAFNPISSRPKSNDKVSSTTLGSTGGSQSFSTASAVMGKKPSLRLNTNLINQAATAITTSNSIAIPQTTQNNQSNRLVHYQQSQSTTATAASEKRLHNSTPKTQKPAMINTSQQQQLVPNQNYSTSLLAQPRHRPQLSNSQLKQGLQGSQANNTIFTSQQAAPATYQSIQSNDIVKVGSSIPKTTTAANLKNFNNLRQFNSLFNYKQVQQQQTSATQNTQQQQNQQSVNAASIQPGGKPQQAEDDILLSMSSHQQKQSLLQLHQKHTTQQPAQSSQQSQQVQALTLSKSNTSKYKSSNTQQQEPPATQRNTQKNLRIAIPSSPRANIPTTAAQMPKESSLEPAICPDKKGSQALADNGQQSATAAYTTQCLSTKNANQGHIKLNKFTCHSTRHNQHRPNMFSKRDDLNGGPVSASGKNQDGPNSVSESEVIDFSNPDSIPLQPAHKIIIPNHESTKHSLKRNGVVRAYAANTNQGLVRNYNEDRVSIILNILKPPNRPAEQHWPRCSFFGIYDGHGGAACADFLRDNLHQFVIKESCFPNNPKEALRIGFQNAEQKFLSLCQNENGIIDKSGSCAIVALIVEDMCYIANVGDSRSILSSDGGNRIYPLSRDHKPCDEIERKRIIEGGGQIYHRTATAAQDCNDPSKKEVIVGPLRVLPGRLSVSRTFGDAEAKIAKFGGNPNVVIATPDIKSFRITKEHDFIVLACDGIFDKLSNEDTIKCVWNSVADNTHMNFAQNIHKQSGMAVEYILKNALLRRTLDNVTVVMIAFSNFKHVAFGQNKGSNRQTNSANQKGNSSSQVSTDNSQILNPTASQAKKKENIPPSQALLQGNTSQALSAFKSAFTQGEDRHQQQQKGTSSRLQIDTSQSCNNQGPKTTTNAALMREASLGSNNNTTSFQSMKKLQHQPSISSNPNQSTLNSGVGSVGTSSNCRSKHFDFSLHI